MYAFVPHGPKKQLDLIFHAISCHQKGLTLVCSNSIEVFTCLCTLLLTYLCHVFIGSLKIKSSSQLKAKESQPHVECHQFGQNTSWYLELEEPQKERPLSNARADLYPQSSSPYVRRLSFKSRCACCKGAPKILATHSSYLTRRGRRQERHMVQNKKLVLHPKYRHAGKLLPSPSQMYVV